MVKNFNLISNPSVDKERKVGGGGKVDLYYYAGSPPCRATLMVARAVGVDVNLKIVNLLEGEQMREEYLKMNPQHIVPTMDDNGFILWESRAIMAYLVDKYAKNDSLNPKDPQKAALVNQLLYFDIGTLFQRFAEYFLPVMMAGLQPDETKLLKFEEALNYLEIYLKKHPWVAGPEMTIADFSVVATICTAEACMVNISKYSAISAWYQRAKKAMEGFGYAEINQAGADAIGGLFRSKVK